MINVSELIQQAQYFQAMKDFEKTIEATTLLIELEEEDETEPLLGNVYTFALQVRCHAYLQLENYSDALEDADILVQILPYEAISYFYRAVAHLQLNNIESAKEDYKHLLSFPLPSEQKISVLYSLGLTEYIAGNYDASIQNYVTSLQLAPAKKPLPYINMGIIHFRLGDMDAAWNAYKTAQQLDPDHDHTLVGLAVLHADEDQWDDALTIWRNLLSKEPHFGDPDEVEQRYYRWTPPMADLARQIIARL
jgi:tetratricopeptide (TPR) repeat protein